jgi:hypothetical protein
MDASGVASDDLGNPEDLNFVVVSHLDLKIHEFMLASGGACSDCTVTPFWHQHGK